MCIMPSFIRLWEKIRGQEMQEWAKSAERQYDWGARGRSSQQAVWLQLLEEEAIVGGECASDDARLTILVDLVKCFDRVRLRHVWQWGVYHGVPKALLRMICVTYSLARTLKMEGTCSEAFSTITTIVPGSVFALWMLHAVLMNPCDKLCHMTRILGVSWGLAKFVDDISLTLKGKAEKIAEAAAMVYDTGERDGKARPGGQHQ